MEKMISSYQKSILFGAGKQSRATCDPVLDPTLQVGRRGQEPQREAGPQSDFAVRPLDSNAYVRSQLGKVRPSY